MTDIDIEMYKKMTRLQKSFTANNRFNKEQGFSLPEILVVIAIIGVLAAIAIPIYMNQKKVVTSADLDAELLNASTIIQAERGQNDGIYPTYTPRELATATSRATIVYTYSTTQLQYCLKGTDDNGVVKYVGSVTNNKVSTTSCWLPNTGGVQPADSDGANTNPVNNHNPEITSLSPSTLYTRAGGETITVTGTDILNGASILYNNVVVPATVLNSNKLTFKNPGASSYKNIDIQIKNPNSRTSEAKILSLVNPILTTTANAPSSIVTDENLTDYDVRAIANTVSCPLGATPNYAFRLIRLGATYNTGGIGFVSDLDGLTLNTDRTNRDVSLSTQAGQRYGLIAKAVCTLEGESGAYSAWTAEEIFTQGIPKPAAPTTSPNISDTNPMVNTNVDYSWAGMMCPTGSNASYELYNGATSVYSGSLKTITKSSGATAGADSFTYSYTCGSAYYTSVESNKSPARVSTVVATPIRPAAATGLTLTSNAGESAGFSWSAVTCDVGSPQYRFNWVTVAGVASTAAGPWQTERTFASSTPTQGEDYVWTVEALCTINGVNSAVATSTNKAFVADVVNPKNSVGTIVNTDGKFKISASNSTIACTAPATVRYRYDLSRIDYTYDGWTSGWSTSENLTISNANQGAYVVGRIQATCANNGRVADVVSSPNLTWTVDINTPGQIPNWTHTGNPKGERWGAITCPTGTRASYWAHAFGAYGNTLAGPAEDFGWFGYDRPVYSEGNALVYSNIKARCRSDFTSSSYSAIQSDTY